MGFLILLKMTSHLIMTPTNKIKMNHIKTMLRWSFPAGIERVRTSKATSNDPPSTSLIKGLAFADACAGRAGGSPIRRNHSRLRRASAVSRREHMTISAQVIDTIVEWIDDNLHQRCIDDIARHAGYSKWHLQRLFLQYKGEPGALYSRNGCRWPPARSADTWISGFMISA